MPPVFGTEPGAELRTGTTLGLRLQKQTTSAHRSLHMHHSSTCARVGLSPGTLWEKKPYVYDTAVDPTCPSDHASAASKTTTFYISEFPPTHESIHGCSASTSRCAAVQRDAHHQKATGSQAYFGNGSMNPRLRRERRGWEETRLP